jgi:hypothetical protein
MEIERAAPVTFASRILETIALNGKIRCELVKATIGKEWQRRSMKKKLQDDRVEQSESEADHPFYQGDLAFNGHKIVFDFGEAVLVNSQRVRRFARLVLGRACGDEGVVDFGNHDAH